MKTKQQRIAMIKDNLAENERLFSEGKRDKKLFATCKKDGKKALAEIRSSERTYQQPQMAVAEQARADLIRRGP